MGFENGWCSILVLGARKPWYNLLISIPKKKWKKKFKSSFLSFSFLDCPDLECTMTVWLVLSLNYPVLIFTWYAGKFIIGYAPICGMKEYYIACVCDELYIPPSAYVGLYGVLVNASFFGGNSLYAYVCVWKENWINYWLTLCKSLQFLSTTTLHHISF